MGYDNKQFESLHNNQFESLLESLITGKPFDLGQEQPKSSDEPDPFAALQHNLKSMPSIEEILSKAHVSARTQTPENVIKMHNIKPHSYPFSFSKEELAASQMPNTSLQTLANDRMQNELMIEELETLLLINKFIVSNFIANAIDRKLPSEEMANALSGLISSMSDEQIDAFDEYMSSHGRSVKNTEFYKQLVAEKYKPEDHRATIEIIGTEKLNDSITALIQSGFVIVNVTSGPSQTSDGITFFVSVQNTEYLPVVERHKVSPVYSISDKRALRCAQHPCLE